VGRLEDIVERNRNPTANRERLAVSIGFGVFLLIILGMLVFTNLGKRPTPAAPAATGSSTAHDHHVDGVQLRVPRPLRAGSGSGSGSSSTR
jgi:hypothetical protein